MASRPAVVNRQRSGGGASQTGTGGEYGTERGRRGWSAVLRGPGGGEIDWGGRMGTATQGGNGTATIGTLGRDKHIGSLDKRRMRK